MKAAALFSPGLLAAWIAAALLTFAASLYFGSGGAGGASGRDAVGPSAFSRSAIGYAGIAEILRRRGVPVLKSTYQSRAKLAHGGVLVLAEPPASLALLGSLDDLLKAPTVLLILPKWHGAESTSHKGWVADVEPAPPAEAEWVLRLAAPSGTVTRVQSASAWSVNALGAAPDLHAPLQLVRSDKLHPIVGGAEGMLVGERVVRGTQIWVLADPDVIANHGIGKGGNADFALALLDALGGRNGVVFDETVHGYVAAPASPLKLLFQFPYVLATAMGAVTIVLLLWATLGRFGAPEAVPPVLGAGKSGLIENAAALLDFAGYRPAVVRRYVQASLRDAAERLHAPRGLDAAVLLDWLRRVGAARGVAIDCAAVAAEAERRNDAAGLAAAARAIHEWKGEILDGPSGDPRLDRPAARRGEESRRRAG